MEKIIHSLAELEKEAGEFVGALVPSKAEAMLVTLSGELGAGKTAFVQAAAKALGVNERVTSPTFVLEKIYQLSADTHFARLIHIDAYRLKSGAELAALGFDELMREAENLIMLEWPERAGDALPPPAHTLALKVLSEGVRTLTVQ